MEKEKIFVPKLNQKEILSYIKEIDPNFYKTLHYYLTNEIIYEILTKLQNKWITTPSDIYKRLKELIKKTTNIEKWKVIVELSLEISKFTNKRNW